MIHVGDPKKLG